MVTMKVSMLGRTGWRRDVDFQVTEHALHDVALTKDLPIMFDWHVADGH